MKTSKEAVGNPLDGIMLKVAEYLIRDFQCNCEDPSFCSNYLAVVKSGNMKEIRSYEWVNKDTGDAYHFKMVHQLENLFKRYRFVNDTYSDAELVDLTVKDFLFTQHRLADKTFEDIRVQTRKVLDYAARYVSKVLGPYDDEECRLLARHGRKATVGVPARDACEAARWEIPITGSQMQISWFDSEMSGNSHVQEYMDKQLSCDPERRSWYQETSSLKLVLVPKTFKSLRAILPNTTIGSYQSLGVGEMIRKRLQRVGFDIRRLQEKHRILARKASVHGKHVTADLSSASDSITEALARELLPSDWFEFLAKMRIKFVKLPDDTVIESSSFCTMGIGYTFPLQTLLFLALLKGIHHVYRAGRKQGLISVYGDDMIYSRDLHVFVLYTFWQLGFLVNESKTFASGHFRESCGGDYYRGVDVRPFQPRNGSAVKSPKALEAMLYKIINGLLRRWSEHEVRQTLEFLVMQLGLMTKGLKVVPGDYPDDAGIKCPSLGCWEFLQHADVLHPKFVGHGLFRFVYLKFIPKIVEERRHAPYYWARLRGSDRTNLPDYGGTDQPRMVTSPIACRIDEVVGVSDCPATPFIVKEIRRGGKPSYQRSKVSGRRFRQTATYRSVSGSVGSYQRQSGLSCFEDRR